MDNPFPIPQVVVLLQRLPRGIFPPLTVVLWIFIRYSWNTQVIPGYMFLPDNRTPYLYALRYFTIYKTVMTQYCQLGCRYTLNTVYVL